MKYFYLFLLSLITINLFFCETNYDSLLPIINNTNNFLITNDFDTLASENITNENYTNIQKKYTTISIIEIIDFKSKISSNSSIEFNNLTLIINTNLLIKANKLVLLFDNLNLTNFYIYDINIARFNDIYFKSPYLYFDNRLNQIIISNGIIYLSNTNMFYQTIYLKGTNLNFGEINTNVISQSPIYIFPFNIKSVLYYDYDRLLFSLGLSNNFKTYYDNFSFINSFFDSLLINYEYKTLNNINNINPNFNIYALYLTNKNLKYNSLYPDFTFYILFNPVIKLSDIEANLKLNFFNFNPVYNVPFLNLITNNINIDSFEIYYKNIGIKGRFYSSSIPIFPYNYDHLKMNKLNILPEVEIKYDEITLITNQKSIIGLKENSKNIHFTLFEYNLTFQTLFRYRAAELINLPEKIIKTTNNSIFLEPFLPEVYKFKTIYDNSIYLINGVFKLNYKLFEIFQGYSYINILDKNEWSQISPYSYNNIYNSGILIYSGNLISLTNYFVLGKNFNLYININDEYIYPIFKTIYQKDRVYLTNIININTSIFNNSSNLYISLEYSNIYTKQTKELFNLQLTNENINYNEYLNHRLITELFLLYGGLRSDIYFDNTFNRYSIFDIFLKINKYLNLHFFYDLHNNKPLFLSANIDYEYKYNYINFFIPVYFNTRLNFKYDLLNTNNLYLYQSVKNRFKLQNNLFFDINFAYYIDPEKIKIAYLDLLNFSLSYLLNDININLMGGLYKNYGINTNKIYRDYKVYLTIEYPIIFNTNTYYRDTYEVRK